MPTSTYGVRYPAATDPADVATDLNELATDVDGILNTIPVMTTKGDLVTRTATAPERLGVGADGTYLLADSTQSTGLRWGAPTFAADPYVMIAEDAKTTSASTSFSFSSIPSTYTDLFLRVSAAFVNASTALVPQRHGHRHDSMRCLSEQPQHNPGNREHVATSWYWHFDYARKRSRLRLL